MWSRIVQCPDSQVSWDHSYRRVVLVLSCTLDPQPCKLHPGLPEEEPSALSCQLVCSTLEYAASIWDSWEKLQRRFAKCVKGDYKTTSSVSQLLHDLCWCDLKDRQRDLRLALLYKIVTGHVAINPDQIGLVASDNRTRANHRHKFRAIGASSTGLRYSFAVRTVSDWNQLPAVVVEQENPAAFKAQLARYAPVRMP